MIRSKKFWVILLIALFLIARWGFEYKLYDYYLSSIEPAEITEPLTTWYAGAAVAADVPESWELQYSTVEFRSSGRPETATLEFTERKKTLPINTIHPPEPRSPLRVDKKLGQEDLSSRLGRPARLAAFFCSAFPNAEFPEKPGFLVLSAEVHQGEARYEFIRVEPLEQSEAPDFADEFVMWRRMAFIKQMIDFLAIYHWTGRNEPPAADQLATGFGYIDLSDGWPQPVIETSLHFKASDSQVDRSYLFGDYLTLEAWHIQDRFSPYRSELENLPVVNSNSYAPDWGLVFIRQENRKSFDFGDQASIVAWLRLSAMPPKRARAYHSYLVGVFNTVFKSLRPIGEVAPSSDGLEGGEK